MESPPGVFPEDNSFQPWIRRDVWEVYRSRRGY
jgi:hypothetical protein